MDLLGRSRTTRRIRYLLLVLLSIYTLFPVAWLLATSLKTARDIFDVSVGFAFRPILDNYRQVLGSSFFPSYVRNSIVVALGSTASAVLIGAPAAYVLARSRRDSLRQAAVGMLLFRMAPPVILMVPLFFLAVRLRLVNTRLALIIANTAFNLPFAIWMLRNFIVANVPMAIEESAKIDGAGPYQLFARIVAPLIRTGLTAVATFCFLFAWNDFLFPLALTSTARAQTLPFAIQAAITARGVQWGPLAATAVLMLIPNVVLFAVVQRHLVVALTGATKG